MNTNAGTVINGKRTTYHTWPYETAGNEAWYSAAGSTLLQSLYVRIDPLSLVPMCGVDVAWSESECYDHEREREQERERECSGRQATKPSRFGRRNEGRKCGLITFWLMQTTTFDNERIYRMRVSNIRVSLQVPYLNEEHSYIKQLRIIWEKSAVSIPSSTGYLVFYNSVLPKFWHQHVHQNNTIPNTTRARNDI